MFLAKSWSRNGDETLVSFKFVCVCVAVGVRSLNVDPETLIKLR